MVAYDIALHPPEEKTESEKRKFTSQTVPLLLPLQVWENVEKFCVCDEKF